MRTRSKHQLTLSVGVVNLTRQEGGQLVRPAHGLVEEALTVASTESKNRLKRRVEENKHTLAGTNMVNDFRSHEVGCLKHPHPGMSSSSTTAFLS